MNLSESLLCSLCHKEQETFTHLFLDCSYSSNLWRDLQWSLSPKLVLLNLNVKSLTIGFMENKTTQIVVNHNLLLFKEVPLFAIQGEGGQVPINLWHHVCL